MASPVDLFVALKFVKLLATPWEEWDAFKLGLINEKGGKIKKAKSDEEKKSMTIFHVLTKNIKKLLEKIPFGKSKLGAYATALFLIREEIGEESFNTVLYELLSSGSNEKILLEDNVKTTDHIIAGMYVIENEENEFDGEMVILSDQIFPIGDIVGTSIYEYNSLTGKEKIYFTSEDLRLI